MDVRLKTLKRALEVWAVWEGFKLVRSLLTCGLALCGAVAGYRAGYTYVRRYVPTTGTQCHTHVLWNRQCVYELLLVM